MSDDPGAPGCKQDMGRGMRHYLRVTFYHSRYDIDCECRGLTNYKYVLEDREGQGSRDRVRGYDFGCLDTCL